MPTPETLEIEAYLHELSEETQPGVFQKELVTEEQEQQDFVSTPQEYQSAATTFESPLMEYIRNLQVKITRIPKEISFISSLYLLTNGDIIHLIDQEQGSRIKKELFELLYPLALNTKKEKFSSFQSQIAQKLEIEQVLNRCYLVLFSNFSQMQAAIIQGIIYDIDRQGVHLPIQSSTELDTIALQYRPIVQNQAVIIRNMFRHHFPDYIPPDNIHILELCFLSLLEEIQHHFIKFLQNDEQLLHMLSRIKVAQDELLNVKDANLNNILAKMERIQNQFHDIYNQRWRDGILNDIISTFFYHARFIAYLENKGKISQKRRYFLASLEHLLNNYEDFYQETLVPQVTLLMEEYKQVDEKSYPFVKVYIRPEQMKSIFKEILDEDRFSVLSEMIVTGEFSKNPDNPANPWYTEELGKMRRELQQKHADCQHLLTYVERLWEILDNIQDLLISEIFTKWREVLTTVLDTFCHEFFWFHACFSTYTIEAFPNKQLLFQKIDQLILRPYQEVLCLFSKGILTRLESLSQQAYAFRDRAGDFNLLYTGILSINLKKEENHFQFELYTPSQIKALAQKIFALQERYIQALNTESLDTLSEQSSDNREHNKNYRLYTDELLKTAGCLSEEREMLMYFGSRKLFTGPQFIEEDFTHLYEEILAIYDHSIARLQRYVVDPLDSILELKSLRERARFEIVYERYTEIVKYKALKKSWQLIRKRQ